MDASYPPRSGQGRQHLLQVRHDPTAEGVVEEAGVSTLNPMPPNTDISDRIEEHLAKVAKVRGA